MTEYRWAAWRKWYLRQLAEEEASDGEAIPFAVCECPARGEEAK